MTLPLTEFCDRVRVATAVALIEMRKRACLSQSEVARRTGIHRPIVCRIERGFHTTSVHVAARFAKACGGSLREVLEAIDIELRRVA